MKTLWLKARWPLLTGIIGWILGNLTCTAVALTRGLSSSAKATPQPVAAIHTAFDTVAIDVTREVQVTREIEVTRVVEVTLPQTAIPIGMPSTVTATETLLPTDTAVPTDIPTRTPIPTRTSVPTRTLIPTKTVRPTSTPIVVPTENSLALHLSLSQFVNKYDSLTDLQRKDFVANLPGKTVDWTGTVFEVRSDGTILVNIPGRLLGAVDLAGVPSDLSITINKDSNIRFTGVIKNVIDFLGLYIYLVDVQVIT